MVKKIYKASGYFWQIKTSLFDFLEKTENVNEFLCFRKDIEKLYHAAAKIEGAFNKIGDLNYYRIIVNFECLDRSIQKDYLFKVCGVKTNLSELLEVAKGISKEAYDFGYLDIYYSYMNRMVIVKKMYIFDTQWVRVYKDEYKKKEILDLILKMRQKNEQNN